MVKNKSTYGLSALDRDRIIAALARCRREAIRLRACAFHSRRRDDALYAAAGRLTDAIDDLAELYLGDRTFFHEKPHSAGQMREADEP